MSCSFVSRFAGTTALVMMIVLAAVAQAADDQTIFLSNDRVGITLDLSGGLPGRWTACSENCGSTPVFEKVLLSHDTGGGRLQWVIPGDAAATARLRALNYEAVTDPDAADGVVTLRSVEQFDGHELVHRYQLMAGSHVLQSELDIPAGAVIELEMGSGFIPEQLPGFGAIYGDVSVVRVDGSGQSTFEFEDSAMIESGQAPGQWAGIRNRFWAVLLRPQSEFNLQARLPVINEPTLHWLADPGGENRGLAKQRCGENCGSTPVFMSIYGGPVEWESLTNADELLSKMLFAALWDFLRALCFGMLYLLNQIQSVVGNAGLSIILLSLAVKILMWPLTYVAERWQDEVNRKASLLKPHLDAIKKEHKGEEAHNRTLAVYKEHGVHPMYTIRSLAGFLIQIPVFIAAFDMLGENFGLNQATFLWIDDLAKPDRWLGLPFSLPFFGGYLNLLPFLMTGFTLWSSMVQTEASLTPELMHQQRLRLYLMAAAFFVLFYTFPAGMVLYWTTNNVLHLIKVLFGKLKQ
jgi:YidC/Oxa1 family membrane protein insertase